MDGDQLRAVGECSFDLNLANHVGDPFHHRVGGKNRRAQAHDLGDGSAIANHLEDLGRDQGDGLGMIQLQATGPALPRQLAG